MDWLLARLYLDILQFDFVCWDKEAVDEYLQASRSLPPFANLPTQVAVEIMQVWFLHWALLKGSGS